MFLNPQSLLKKVCRDSRTLLAWPTSVFLPFNCPMIRWVFPRNFWASSGRSGGLQPSPRCRGRGVAWPGYRPHFEALVGDEVFGLGRVWKEFMSKPMESEESVEARVSVW